MWFLLRNSGIPHPGLSSSSQKYWRSSSRSWLKALSSMDLSSRCPNSILRALTRRFGTWFYRPLIFAALNHWSWELDVEKMDSGQYQPRGFLNLIRATSFWPHLRCQGAKYRNVWNKETKEFRCKWTGWQLGRAKSFGGVQIGKFSGDSKRQVKICKVGVFCPANYAATHLRGLIVLGTLKEKFQGSAWLSILSPTKCWSTFFFFFYYSIIPAGRKGVL